MDQELDNDTGLEGVDEAVLKEAREMGWTPKDKFRGNPDKWVSAEEYVERGYHVMPILRANNDRLKNDLLTRDMEIGTLRQQLATTNTIVKDLQGHFDEKLQAELAAQRRSLKADLKEAVSDRDVDAELEIRDQLDALTEAERKAQERAKQNKDKLTTAAPKDSDPQPELSPEFMEWKKENSWYGGTTPEDKKRTKAILRIAEDLRDDGEKSQGLEFMNLCLEELEKIEQPQSRGSSKVEAGNPRSNSGGGQGSYASLPAEAKRACEEFADDLVGEGKVYKTLKEFQTYYAKTYYESN